MVDLKIKKCVRKKIHKVVIEKTYNCTCLYFSLGLLDDRLSMFPIRRTSNIRIPSSSVICLFGYL